MNISDVSSASAATAQQVKLQKGALKQQEAVIATLISSATTQAPAPEQNGQRLNVVA